MSVIVSRRRSTTPSVFAGVAVLLASIVLIAAPASAYSCGSIFLYRGYDIANNVTTARAVQSKIKIPSASAITGESHGDSVADVYLYSGSDFVQAGWYVGPSNGTGLSSTTSPKFFFGEYNPNATGDENLHTSASLAWGSTHTVKISFDSTAGNYDYYLDGVYKGQTARTHFTQGHAGFNGEIDYACVRMEGRATNAPNKTLQYATFGSSGTTWHWFVDQRGYQTHNGVTIVSTSGGTAASDYAYGGGS